MSSATVYSAVETFLKASWTATPLAWENTPFDKPEPPSPWILMEVYGDSYDQASIGSGSPTSEAWREEGGVLAHVFAPAGTGSLAVRQHAEALATLLKGLQLPGGTVFKSMSIGTGESNEEGGAWWRLTLSARWQRG